jgi:hypothetical protein
MVGLLLNLHLNKKLSENGSENFYHKDVLKILQNVMLPGVYDHDEAGFSKEIIQKNLVYIPGERIRKLNPLLELIFIEGVNATSFLPYLIKVFEKFAEFNAPSGFSQLETEATGRIISQLKRFSDILETTQVVYNFRSLIRLINKFLQSISIPFTGEPLAGLQIMGILETRTLDFENLIILSMNEGIFPKSGNVPSMIPYSLRKGFGMPTIEHQDSIYAYYFYRLLHRAKHVYLIYSSSANDMQAAEPSRFIRQLMIENCFRTRFRKIVYNVFPIEQRNVEIKKTKEIRDLLVNKYASGSQRILTPSAINMYLNCSLRFYFRYVSEIEEPENIFESIEANTLGNILHKAMELLYLPFVGTEVSQEELFRLQKDNDTIKLAVDEAFWHAFFKEEKKFPGKDAVNLSGKNILIREVIISYVKSILEQDRKKTPFIVKALESNQYIEIEPEKSLKIKIGGIIDRIDEIENQLRIIDYKTGSYKGTIDSIEYLFGNEPAKRSDAVFQVLLYSMIVAEKNKGVPVIPELYFVRTMREENYSPAPVIKENKIHKKLEHFSQVESFYKSTIKQVLSQMFSVEGYFSQTEEIKNCSYCPYRQICAR